MNPWQSGGMPRPSPEQWAAFADGEADALARRAVDAWLAEHPEDWNEVERQRDVTRLVRATPPPEPDPAAWDAVCDRIARGLPDAPPVGTPGRSRPWFAWLGLGGAAAAVVLAALNLPFGGPTADSVAPDEVLAVASPEDVEIISMNAADEGALVVGRPPWSGALVLAAHGDVTVEEVSPGVEVVLPNAGRADGPSVPIILVPGKE